MPMGQIGAGRMTYQNRRGFFGMAAAGVGAAWASGACALERDAPHLVVLNAKVYTVDAAMPRAQAFAVKGARFVAVGSNEDIRSLMGPRTQTFDAQGATVVP